MSSTAFANYFVIHFMFPTMRAEKLCICATFLKLFYEQYIIIMLLRNSCIKANSRIVA